MDKVRNRRMRKRYQRIWPYNAAGQELLDWQYRYLWLEHRARDIRRRVLAVFFASEGISLEDVRRADGDELAEMVADVFGNPYFPGVFDQGMADWPRDEDGLIDLYGVAQLARGMARLEMWQNAR